MTLNYIERMKCYNNLKQDYNLQKIENGKKQERITQLHRELLDIKRENDELRKELQELKGELLNKKRGRKKND